MANLNVLQSIVKMKCPRCHTGDLYAGPITEGIYKMHKSCKHCNQPYEIEPGFYWGAMYIGYGLSGGYMLSTVTIFILAFQWSVNFSFLIAILGGIVIFPFVARYARTIWIHIYVPFDKKFRDENNQLDNNVNTETHKS